MLLERVRTTIDRHGMLPDSGSLVVAVSGGVDSVVLFELLYRLAPDRDITLHIAHLDHGIRGGSSEDAAFVRRLADRHGVPFHGSRLEPDALASPRGGLEAAARTARYAFLRSVADGIGAGTIALGHTADDQAETVVYRLARGTGPEGLSGIPAVRRPYVRPLIEVTRDELLRYARERGLAWRDDPSNANVTFARNRIRHRVVPELRSINPKAVEAIGRAAELTADAEEAIRFLVSRLANELGMASGETGVTAPRDAVCSIPPPVRGRLLREAIRRVRGTLTGIEHAHIDAVDRLVAGNRSHGRLSLPGLHLRVHGNEIRFAPARERANRHWSAPVGLGETNIPELPMALRLELGDRPPRHLSADRRSEVADADRVLFPLVVRSRRDGDRFAPLGMKHRMKLKDFLINERVPYFDRPRLPLLCDREKIVWVVGMRLSDEVRIRETTRRFLRMEVTDRR